MRQSRSDVRQGDAADRALDHPDIVHVYDIATDADTTFIAMEHVPGKTLGELCRPLAQPAAANRVCWPGSCRSSSGSLLNHQMNEDFLDPLRAFIDAAARFLVVGAYALAHHGRPRGLEWLLGAPLSTRPRQDWWRVGSGAGCGLTGS